MIKNNGEKNGEKIKSYFIETNNNSYEFLIEEIKEKNKIIIRCNNDYIIKLTLEEIIKNTKVWLESIEEAFILISNIFNNNKVSIIKDSINENIIKISLKIFNNITNKEDERILILTKKENIYYKYNLLQNEIYKLKEENKKCNELFSFLFNEIKNIKKENALIKRELNELKSSNLNKHNDEKDKNDINKDIDNNNYEISPNLINSSITLIKEAYGYYEMDNTFIVFNSYNDISHIIYVKENNSIINYNLIQQNIIAEIKNAHEKIITNFNHYFDDFNKKDIIMSISAEDCNIKLWNLSTWENILFLKNIYLSGCLFSACFITDNLCNYINYNYSLNYNCCNNYIVTSNCSDFSGLIKIYNFNGDLIKEIEDSNDETYFIDSLYDNKSNKIYIITGNKGYVKSYDYYNNKLYQKYYDSDLSKSHDSVVVSEDKNNDEYSKLIDSCQNGFISIWNFHTGLLLHKINIGYNYLEGICLWNENYLFVGGGDNSIKLIEIKNGLIIKSLTGHKENVLSIKKIKHKIYKECLVSQGNDGNIKLWIYKNEK